MTTFTTSKGHVMADTPSAHVSSLLMKLGVSNRGEAAAAARDLGI